MNIHEQIEEAKALLKALKKKLVEVDKLKDKKFNIFNSVGMQTQEIRHSAFLAWLLNPDKPENIKFDFLSEFLKDIYNYSSNEIVNSTVIDKTAHVKSAQELLKLIDFDNENKVKVETERTLTKADDDGRIDIYIEVPNTKTIIVIENKTFTTSHDDQLNRYVGEFSDRQEWKKIFIYLTPKGDLPTEEHNNNWCLYSYERINAILTSMLNDVSNRKLKYLIGDYIYMVDMNIIKNNKELNALCKKIKREHSQALEILNSYSDNIEKVIEYCIKYLSDNIVGFQLINSTNQNFSFYTDATKEYFERHGESLFRADNTLRCSGGIRCDDGPVKAGWGTGKLRNEVWSPAQLKLMREFAPSKKHTAMYFTFPGNFCPTLMTYEDRGFSFEEALEKILDLQLKLYVKTINEFNERIKTL